MKTTVPILMIREAAVVLDADLAALYGVETKVLNQAVKRNAERFPEDFCFQLTSKEFSILKSQIAISRSDVIEEEEDMKMWSQFVTTSSKYRKAQAFPYAFTEHGALMAASILNSKEAVTMSLYIIRAFVKQREALSANQVILKRLAEIDKTLLTHDSALRKLYQQLLPLLQPGEKTEKPFIGFKIKEPAARYRAGKSSR
jgi:hypothetical protein